MTINHSYPEYSFDELISESDRIDYCELIKVEPARFTTYTNGQNCVVTDYIFRSKEIIDKYFILRIKGGIVDNVTVNNTDNIFETMVIGFKYVLFLNDLQIQPETEHYTYYINDQVLNVDSFYSLIIGTSSIFIVDDKFASEEIKKSFDEKYSVDRDTLISAYNSK